MNIPFLVLILGHHWIFPGPGSSQDVPGLPCQQQRWVKEPEFFCFIPLGMCVHNYKNCLPAISSPSPQHFVLHTWPGVFVQRNTTALRQISEAWEVFLPCTHMVSLTASSSAPLTWIPHQNQGQPYWLHHRHLVPFLYQPNLSQNQLVLLESFPELPS